MSYAGDPWMVIEFVDGQRTAHRVWNVTSPAQLEDKWQAHWDHFGQICGERIRVGLAIAKYDDELADLKIDWLGYRDAVVAPDEDSDGAA